MQQRPFNNLISPLAIALLCMLPTLADADVNSFNSGMLLQQQLSQQQQLLKNTQPAELGKPTIEQDQDMVDSDTMTDAEADSLTVAVKQIVLENAYHLPQVVAQSKIRSLEGKSITFSQLRQLCAELSALYTQEGYAGSKVFIPPQKIQDGQIRLYALEGKVNQITLIEGRYFKKNAIVTHIDAQKEGLFNVKHLKNSMRQINKNPDVKVSATLKPGSQPQSTDVQLNVTERFPLHITPSFSNLGRRLIGKEQFSVNVQENNLLGLGDRLNVTGNFTEHSQGFAGNYEVPIGRKGTLIGLGSGYSRNRLAEELEPLDVEGVASIMSPYIAHPIVSTEKWEVTPKLSFDFKQIDTDVLGVDFTRDQLRILRPSLFVQEFDRHGITNLQTELGIGVNLFGAGNINQAGVPHSGDNGSFFRSTSDFSRIQKLPWGSTGILRMGGQLGGNGLVSSEQLQVGGAFSVRGYREGQYIGDKGLYANLEWRLPLRIFPESWHLPFTKRPLKEAIQLVGFIDYGSVFSSGEGSTAAISEHALGAGLGTRIQLNKYLNARLDVGLPVLRGDNTTNQSPRFHFGIESPLF